MGDGEKCERSVRRLVCKSSKGEGEKRVLKIRMLWFASIGKDSKLTKSGKCIEVKQCTTKILIFLLLWVCCCRVSALSPYPSLSLAPAVSFSFSAGKYNVQHIMYYVEFGVACMCNCIHETFTLYYLQCLLACLLACLLGCLPSTRALSYSPIYLFP